MSVGDTKENTILFSLDLVLWWEQRVSKQPKDTGRIGRRSVQGKTKTYIVFFRRSHSVNEGFLVHVQLAISILLSVFEEGSSGLGGKVWRGRGTQEGFLDSFCDSSHGRCDERKRCDRPKWRSIGRRRKFTSEESHPTPPTHKNGRSIGLSIYRSRN